MSSLTAMCHGIIQRPPHLKLRENYDGEPDQDDSAGPQGRDDLNSPQDTEIEDTSETPYLVGKASCGHKI